VIFLDIPMLYILFSIENFGAFNRKEV
jgi:hypothetical protein